MNAPAKLTEMLDFLKEKKGWTLTSGEAAVFTFDVRLLDGRCQLVQVTFKGKDIHGNDVVEFASKACELKDLKEGLRGKTSGGLTKLLKANDKNYHVAFCIDDKDIVWSKAVRMMGNLDETEMEVVIHEAAAQADAIEKEKFGDEDIF